MAGETEFKTITTYVKAKWQRETENNQLIHQYQHKCGDFSDNY
jgi:hypothetical protein